MKEISAKHKWWKTPAVIFAVFTIYILFCALQSTFRNLHSEQSKPWTDIFSLQIVWGYVWASLTLVIIPLSNRYSITRQQLARNLLLHLGFGVVFASIHRLLYIILVQQIAPNALTIPNSELPRFFYFLHFISESFLDYLFILAVLQAIMYYREFHERESRLQQAELQTLKTQLHPHFLFNTLNAISALVYSNPKMADRTIAQLSDLLRLSVKSGKTQEVSLKEELDFLRKYVEIQQTLLQERLQVQWNIDSEALDARLPNMILQPLVENSIRHGIAPKKGGGCIEIGARRENGTLRLFVSDNGTGISPETKLSEGLGLTNTRERLRHLYGEAFEFSLDLPPDGGLTVRLGIPFQEEVAGR
ncbi:MAG TPA: histidine kinase [Pyrinomonadaceae bacterium]|nr:histidine kinase [Pyrinomonadaceae bacterium]